MTTIITKNSVVPGNEPTFLAPGELAVNTADGVLWVGDQASVPKFLSQATFVQSSSITPANAKETALWWQTDTETLLIFEGGQWRTAMLSKKSGGVIKGHIKVTRKNQQGDTLNVFETTNSGSKVYGTHEVAGDTFFAGDVILGGKNYDGVPPGTVALWAAPFSRFAEPPGWLIAQGQTINRNNDAGKWAPLYEAIGRQYTDATLPSNLFMVPDLRGLHPRFHNAGRAGTWSDPDRNSREDHRPDGPTGITGNGVGTTQPTEFKEHSHDVFVNNTVNNTASGGIRPPEYTDTVTYVTTDTFNTGLENRGNNVNLWGIIKY